MDTWAITAALFATCSLTLTFYAILGHMNNFTKPYLQRYIIRILLMVPIYSMNAWIAMIVPEAGLYLDSMREVYESFVIYSFMKYLLNYLHYDTDLEHYIDQKPGPKQLFPLCFLPTCSGGRLFMIRCKHGILQYVVVRPITTLIAFASQEFGFYGEGNYNPFSGYTYPILLNINNISQIMAMYCLVIFYTGYRQELHPMKPLAKFFSIKLVVFFSFFQSVLIGGLMEIDWVEQMAGQLFPELEGKKLAISRKLQEFLICIDMFIAAIGHQFAFPSGPFVEQQSEDEEGIISTGGSSTLASGRSRSSSRSQSPKNNSTCCEALWSLFDFEDEKGDISEHFGHIFWRLRRLFCCKLEEPLLPEDVLVDASSNAGSNITNADNGSQMDDEFMTRRETSSNNNDNSSEPLQTNHADRSNKYESLT